MNSPPTAARLSAAFLAAGLAAAGAGAVPAPPVGPPAVLSTSASDWHVEHDVPSAAALAVARDGVHLIFALAPGRPTSQFAAAVVRPPAALQGYSRLTIRATADRPMRIAIQLRGRDDIGAARWRRTMYVDEQAHEGTFDLNGFVPVGPEVIPAPPLAAIGALMLGVDTVNTRPGTRGTITFADVRLER